MGAESRDLASAFAESQGEALFGRAPSGKRGGGQLPFPKETVFRVFIGCLDDPAKREEYEALLTQSYRCQAYLKNPGDLTITSISGSFDKEGCYHVVAPYAIIPEKMDRKTPESPEDTTEADHA